MSLSSNKCHLRTFKMSFIRVNFNEIKSIRLKVINFKPIKFFFKCRKRINSTSSDEKKNIIQSQTYEFEL